MTPRRRTLLSLTLALAGLCSALVYGPWQLYQVQRVSRWDTVEGEVVARDVVRSGARRASKVRYVLDVRYSYKFDGRPYVGARWSPTGDRSFVSRDDAWAAAPDVGTRLTVRVDPDAPGASFLDEGSTGEASAVIGFGVVLLLAAFFARSR